MHACMYSKYLHEVYARCANVSEVPCRQEADKVAVLHESKPLIRGARARLHVPWWHWCVEAVRW